MNFLQIKTTIETELSSWWPTSGNTPILWENTQMQVGDDTNIYIIPQIIPANSDKIEFGYDGIVEVVGTISFKVIGKVDQGSGQIYTKADLLNNHFSDGKFGEIHTSAGRIIVLGTNENRFQISVLIPFNTYQNPRS